MCVVVVVCVWGGGGGGGGRGLGRGEQAKAVLKIIKVAVFRTLCLDVHRTRISQYII